MAAALLSCAFCFVRRPALLLTGSRPPSSLRPGQAVAERSRRPSAGGP